MMKTEVQITTNVDLTDAAMGWATAAMDSSSFWIVPALFASMIVVQFFKGLIKCSISAKHREVRKGVTQFVAFIIGYIVGIFLIESPDASKWAVLTGICNPVLYIGLKTLAVSRNWYTLQSMLKMRPLIKNPDGSVTFDRTQTILLRKEAKS